MKKTAYNGRYVKGSGEQRWMELIDKSLTVLRPSATLPCIQMLYLAKPDHFVEGFIWGDGWWMQNSYGFTLGAIPLLDRVWQKKLQKSYDLFWDRIGDGKRSGRDDGVIVPERHHLNFVAPDGALGDYANSRQIAYRQGDNRFDLHDWFYEATAAGVLMQCEMLLFSHDTAAAMKYLPLMRRSLAHIESTRAENGLFLVGAGANLLAPSYGGSRWNSEKQELEKGYLTGLSVTMCGAASRFIEVLKMVGLGDSDEAALWAEKLALTKKSLETLLTSEGYYIKSRDPDGTPHGVYGAEKYGYLEAVCNVDAIAVGGASYERGEAILNMIENVPNIRPAGTICNNYPHLDDTYENYFASSHRPDSTGFRSGDWVDGGCWATVEGRALLAYLRHGRYSDALRAAEWYMRWNEEYRMDEPLSQWGHNIANPWADETWNRDVPCKRPAAVMVDNFAASSCLIRGVYGLEASADSLYVTPHLPDSVRRMDISSPVYYASSAITVSVTGGDEPLRAWLDGNPLETVHRPGEAEDALSAVIPASLMDGGTHTLTLDRSGRGKAVKIAAADASVKRLSEAQLGALPPKFADIARECSSLIEETNDPAVLHSLSEVSSALIALADRLTTDFSVHELRPMTLQRRKAIIAIYENMVLELWKGHRKLI